MEEYDGQWRPGTLLSLLIVLRKFRLLILLSLHRLLSVHGFNLSFNEWSWQIGWPNANQQSSMRGACSVKYCMLYPSHQYWADWLLCQLVTPGPFHTPCARRPAPFLEQPAKPNGADGNRWRYANTFALKWAASQ
jgi:hypothetical protein